MAPPPTTRCALAEQEARRGNRVSIGQLRDVRDALGVTIFTALAIVVLMALVGGLTWAGIEISNAVSNSTAKSVGAAQVKRDTNNGTNQETASATFNQIWTQILSYEDQVKQAKAAGMDPGDLLALEQTCDGVVQQWNADTQTLTMQPYVPAGKPLFIDQTDACD